TYFATPTDYLNGGENHFYHHSLLRFVSPRWNHEKRLFFGFIPWAVATVGMAAYVIPTRHIKAGLGQPEEAVAVIRGRAFASAGTVLVGFGLSLGPYLQWNHHVSRIPLPYLWLSKILLGFSLMRVPARFAFVGLFGLAILTGLGFQAILRGLQQRAIEGFT